MSDIPRGTLTFLFTDIEGSTKLWQDVPDAMRIAISRHDDLLKTIIGSHNGYVFKTVGDAVCAAFPVANDAIVAAVDAQKQLSNVDWGGIDELKVRMALHTGAAEEDAGDYFGLPLSRVARLLSAGHGGQLLVSQSTFELVRDHIAPGLELRDLGEHRLKDLVRSEHVYEVRWDHHSHPNAPLRTIDNRPNNLPQQPTPLVGREREVERVCSLLRRDDVRLVTLTGPGGTGKTRLCLQVGADMIDEFPDGIYFVALASLSDPNLVASAIGQAIGLSEGGERSPEEHLISYLQQRRFLLILDNFEQIVDAAPLVQRLLSSTRLAKILVTSRELLHLRGEYDFQVPTLSVPDADTYTASIATLSQFEAVRLFLDRAVATNPSFQVNLENAPAIAEICHRLDGLPLAIELAVARIRLLTPQAMLSRLENRLPLLGRGNRDLPHRQQTLRNTIQWSYELLSADEQDLYRRLGVFSGGWTLDAAAVVCHNGVDVLEGLESLIDKSLVRQQQVGADSRFVMLETIREYAVERLQENDGFDDAAKRHLEYFRNLAGVSEPKLRGPDYVVELGLLKAEMSNFRAGYEYARKSGDFVTAFRMISDLWWLYFRAGLVNEGYDVARGAVEEILNIPAEIAVRVRRTAAFLGTIVGQHDYSIQQCGEIIKTCEIHNLTAEIGWAYFVLATTNTLRNDVSGACDAFEQSFRYSGRIDDAVCTAEAKRMYGWLLATSGNAERGNVMLEEAFGFFSKSQDVRGMAVTQLNWGMAALSQGDFTRARHLLEESMSTVAQTNDRWHAGWALFSFAVIAAETERNFLKSATLFGASEKCATDLDLRYPPFMNENRESTLVRLHSELDEIEFDAAWDRGIAMSFKESIEYALSGDDEA